MRNLPERQKGASAIATFIVLVLLAYGVYIGIQYVPQMIESKSVDSILDKIASDQPTSPVSTESEAEAKVVRMLQVNEMNDMSKNLEVRRGSGKIIIRFSYDRELNLGFKKHLMHYEKILELAK
jgi:hypothetical protein